jgi:hypothetical protein
VWAGPKGNQVAFREVPESDVRIWCKRMDREYPGTEKAALAGDKTYN